jgi:hypothetical protein
MINDSDKFSERFRWLENLFSIDDRKFKYLFWFFSLLTIPVFAYLYMLPIGLLVGLVSELFDLSEDLIDTLRKFGAIMCFVFGFCTQLYLWKLYKNKREQKDTAISQQVSGDSTGNHSR